MKKDKLINILLAFCAGVVFNQLIHEIKPRHFSGKFASKTSKPVNGCDRSKLPHFPVFLAIISTRHTSELRKNFRKKSYLRLLPYWNLTNIVTTRFMVAGGDTSLEEEQAEFGDVVELKDAPENYDMLTNKIADMMMYAHDQCEFTFDYLLKADDDVWLDLDKYYIGIKETFQRALDTETMRNNATIRGGVFGTLFGQSGDWEPHTEGKWRDPTYPLKYLAPFANGQTYTVTRSVVTYVAEQEKLGMLQHHHNEDTSLALWMVPLNVKYVDGVGAFQVHTEGDESERTSCSIIQKVTEEYERDHGIKSQT